MIRGLIRNAQNPASARYGRTLPAFYHYAIPEQVDRLERAAYTDGALSQVTAQLLSRRMKQKRPSNNEMIMLRATPALRREIEREAAGDGAACYCRASTRENWNILILL